MVVTGIRQTAELNLCKIQVCIQWPECMSEINLSIC